MKSQETMEPVALKKINRNKRKRKQEEKKKEGRIRVYKIKEDQSVTLLTTVYIHTYKCDSTLRFSWRRSRSSSAPRDVSGDHVLKKKRER